MSLSTTTLDTPCADDVRGPLRRAIELGAALQRRAIELQTPGERRQQADLDRMLQSPTDKATLTQTTDQAFRSKRPARMADQLIHILDVQGVPRFFGPVDRTMLLGFRSFADYVPGVAMPLVEAQIRRETANVILPAAPEMLARHLADRRAEGVRMNVNFLAEAILGEREADRRFKAILQALQMPEVEVMSVKISTIYSQISTVACEFPLMNFKPVNIPKGRGESTTGLDACVCPILAKSYLKFAWAAS